MNSLHRRFAVPLVLVLLALAAGPSASPRGDQPPFQLPPRDTPSGVPAAPAGTGSISGTVMVAGSGQPARRARVTLSGGELRGGRTTSITDDLGRFGFPNLPEGRFTLSATKPGHVNVTYGQRQPGAGRPGTPIQLGDGQNLEVHLQMPRGGVITGVVVDEHGEAIPGTQVRAMRYVMQSGQRTLQQGGSGATDDRGVYRIYGLQPGEYIVGATPRNTAIPFDVSRFSSEMTDLVIRAEAIAVAAPQAREAIERATMIQAQMQGQEEDTAGYAPVYFPGTTSAAGAGTVTVGAAEERAGMDFQLQLVPMARVEGIVVTSTSEAPQNVQISLLNIGENVPGVGNLSARPDAEGRFRIPNVPPGQYLLTARSTLGGPAGRGGRAAAAALVDGFARGRAMAGANVTRLWAMTEIGVDGRNVSNVVLTLQPGMSVSGRIAFDAIGLQPPTDMSRIRVNIAPAVTAGPGREVASAVTGTVDASGQFTIPGVAPGRYRLTATNAGAGWVVGSSLVGGHDALDFPFEVKPNQSVSGAVVTFTDRQADLSGTIVSGQGQPVPEYTIVVYPSDRTYWVPQSRRILSTRPATDGSFTFRNIPPGEYRIAPVLDPEPGAWFDPAFLQQLDNTALRVSVADGEKKVQNLRIALGAQQ